MQYKFKLVLDACVDEVTQEPALYTVIGLSRIINGPVRHTTTDHSVRIVAPARFALSCDWLVSRIYAAYMRPNGTAKPPWIP